MSRPVIEPAQKLVRGTEKLALKWYQGKADPPNVLSIGYGHVIGLSESYLKAGITQEKAEQLFANDLASHSKFIEGDIKPKFPLDDFVFGACASLAYNNGARVFTNAPSITGPLRTGDVKRGVLAFWKFCKSGVPLQYRDGLFYRRLVEMHLALRHVLVTKPDECKAARTLMNGLAEFGNISEMVEYFNSHHRKDLCVTCKSKH